MPARARARSCWRPMSGDAQAHLAGHDLDAILSQEALFPALAGEEARHDADPGSPAAAEPPDPRRDDQAARLHVDRPRRGRATGRRSPAMLDLASIEVARGALRAVAQRRSRQARRRDRGGAAPDLHRHARSLPGEASSVPLKLDFAPEAEAQERRVRETRRRDGEIDIEVMLNEDDPPEPIVDGVIDLGAVTLEFLCARARSLSAQARRELRYAGRGQGSNRLSRRWPS